MRALICIVLGLAVVGCKEEKVEPPALIRSVRYVVVANDASARQRNFSGTIRAGNRTRMSFQVPGRVRRVAVKVGDRMKKDQLVAKLDPMDFDLQLREAEASAAQAEAQQRSALASYERVRALYENQNASRQDLDNARATRDTSASATAASRQAVHRLRRQLQYATLTAPASGTISDVFVEDNEVVTAGQVVAVLQVGEQLEVAVDVPESIINNIERGDPVTAQVSAVDQEVQGQVYEVGVPASGGAVFPITVRLDMDPSKRVRAGMAADVTFKVRRLPDEQTHRVVPATAVGEDRDGRFVFVVEPTSGGLGVVRRKAVTLGNLVGDSIEVLSGVEDGQRVVTAGVSRIRDGLEVKVPSHPGDEKPPEPKAQPPVATDEMPAAPPVTEETVEVPGSARAQEAPTP